MAETREKIKFLQLSKLQWQQFGKGKSNWFVVLLFLCAGFYGLYQGFVEKSKKLTTIQSFRGEKDSLFADMKAGLDADTALPAGKAKFRKSSSLSSGVGFTRLPSYKIPVSSAIYNIGQSDVLTYYYLFALENFEMQLFKQTEINNPLRALAGHFDLSFWIIHLLPLLILLFTFNALSAELDNGNWRLIASQGITERLWLQSKFFIAAIAVLALVMMITTVGTILNVIVFNQPPDLCDVLFFSTSVVYIFFWLSLFYFINSLRKPTTYNALVSGIAWISICFISPVLVSKIAGEAVPVDNTKISTYSRRPQNPQIEESKAFAEGMIKKFAALQPAYENADSDSTKPSFTLRTYHSYHWLLHKERWPVVQQYFNAIERRQEITNWSTIINPAGSTDGFLTVLADNDAESYHQFIHQTECLHTALQDAFYPALFSDKSLTTNNYKALSAFQYQRNKIPVSVIIYYLLMLVMSVFLVKSGNHNCNKIVD